MGRPTFLMTTEILRTNFPCHHSPSSYQSPEEPGRFQENGFRCPRHLICGWAKSVEGNSSCASEEWAGGQWSRTLLRSPSLPSRNSRFLSAWSRIDFSLYSRPVNPVICWAACQGNRENWPLEADDCLLQVWPITFIAKQTVDFLVCVQILLVMLIFKLVKQFSKKASFWIPKKMHS